jgi:hypothetical protein
MAAAPAPGRDASILSPLSQAFGADDHQPRRTGLLRRLLRRGGSRRSNRGSRHARNGRPTSVASGRTRTTAMPWQMQARGGWRSGRLELVRSDSVLGMERDTCFPQFQPWRERRWRAGARPAARPIPRICVAVAGRSPIKSNGAGVVHVTFSPAPRAALGGARSGGTGCCRRTREAKIRSPSSVSPIGPYGRVIAAGASGR